MAVNALQFDGITGTRLRMASAIAIGPSESFEIFAWMMRVRLDDSTFVNPTLIAKRASGSTNPYPMFWRLGRYTGAGDSLDDATAFRRLHFIHYDGDDGVASHYYGDNVSVWTPQLTVGQWYTLGGWSNWADIPANVAGALAVVNGTSYSLVTPDALDAYATNSEPVTIGGLGDPGDTNEAKITVRDLAIMSVKPNASFWSGVTAGQSPLRFRSQLRHLYRLDNLTTGLVDQIGGINLVADGGVSVVTDGPAGVEDMVAYSSRPDSTANNDMLFRIDTGASAGPNATASTICNALSIPGGRYYCTLFDLWEDGEIPTNAVLGQWLLTIMFVVGSSRDAVPEALGCTIQRANLSPSPTNFDLTANVSALGTLGATVVNVNAPSTNNTAITADISTLVAEHVAAGLQYLPLIFRLAEDTNEVEVISANIATADNATEASRPLLEGAWAAAAAGGGGAQLITRINERRRRRRRSRS